MERTLTDEETEMSAETAIAAAEAHTLTRWRIAGRYFGLMVSARVAGLAGHDLKEPLDEGRLREVNALVLSARRVMELEDRYEQKVRARCGSAAGDAAREGLERIEQIARAAGIRFDAAGSGTNAQGGAQ